MGFTNFYVSKEPGASDNNGGGPRDDGTGGYVDTSATATVDATGKIIAHGGVGWADVEVDDWVVWDVNNVLLNGQEWRRVTNIAALPVSFTIDAAVNGAAPGGPVEVIVGGHWLTVNHPLGNTALTDCEVIRTSIDHHASPTYPSRVNVKGYALGVNDYTEDIIVNSSGPVTYEGYETEAGDRCPNGVRPVVRLGVAAFLVDLNSYDRRLFGFFRFRQVATKNLCGSGGGAFSSEGNVFYNCWFDWDSNSGGSHALFDISLFGTNYLDCEISITNAGTGSIGSYFYYSKLIRCLFRGGNAIITGVCLLTHGSLAEFCIFKDGTTWFAPTPYPGCALGNGSKAINCIVYNCKNGFYAYNTSGSVQVINSIAYDNTVEGFVGFSGLDWKNNCAFGNGIDFSITLRPNRYTDSFVADPLFRDAAAGDFRLDAGSPCIGEAALLFPFIDRVSESTSRLDIGVFQTGSVLGKPGQVQD